MQFFQNLFVNLCRGKKITANWKIDMGGIFIKSEWEAVIGDMISRKVVYDPQIAEDRNSQNVSYHFSIPFYVRKNIFRPSEKDL